MPANLKTADKADISKQEKYLTFILADEEYGLEILKVREIIGMMKITSVPKTPKYVKGVINLRGVIIPVIDLRLKFGLEETAYTEETCIIVVNVKMNENEVLMGIIVDTVSEVLDISADNIEEAPSFGGNVETEYILGMGKVKDGVKILLDIDKVLSSKELIAISKLQKEEK
jgi:purine-binding chemotaxis protein CheW